MKYQELKDYIIANGEHKIIELTPDANEIPMEISGKEWTACRSNVHDSYVLISEDEDSEQCELICGTPYIKETGEIGIEWFEVLRVNMDIPGGRIEILHYPSHDCGTDRLHEWVVLKEDEHGNVVMPDDIIVIMASDKEAFIADYKERNRETLIQDIKEMIRSNEEYLRHETEELETAKKNIERTEDIIVKMKETLNKLTEKK